MGFSASWVSRLRGLLGRALPPQNYSRLKPRATFAQESSSRNLSGEEFCEAGHTCISPYAHLAPRAFIHPHPCTLPLTSTALLRARREHVRRFLASSTIRFPRNPQVAGFSDAFKLCGRRKKPFTPRRDGSRPMDQGRWTEFSRGLHLRTATGQHRSMPHTKPAMTKGPARRRDVLRARL